MSDAMPESTAGSSYVNGKDHLVASPRRHDDPEDSEHWRSRASDTGGSGSGGGESPVRLAIISSLVTGVVALVIAYFGFAELLLKAPLVRIGALESRVSAVDQSLTERIGVVSTRVDRRGDHIDTRLAPWVGHIRDIQTKLESLVTNDLREEMEERLDGNIASLERQLERAITRVQALEALALSEARRNSQRSHPGGVIP